MGWAGLANGKLLQAMTADFDVLVTCDKNIQYQQNPSLPVALLVLDAPDNHVPTILALAPKALAILPTLQRGDIRRINAE